MLGPEKEDSRQNRAAGIDAGKAAADQPLAAHLRGEPFRLSP